MSANSYLFIKIESQMYLGAKIKLVKKSG